MYQRVSPFQRVPATMPANAMQAVEISATTTTIVDVPTTIVESNISALDAKEMRHIQCAPDTVTA